jgi:hypothetical protein
MAKKITSYNQSGGITAEKVPVDNNVNAPDIKVEQSKTAKKKTGWGKVVAVLVAVATIVSGTIALLQYFGFGGTP